MKAAGFDYVAPTTLAAALDALSAPESRVLAGGQSLGPMMNLRLATPRLLVDLAGIAELRTVGNGARHTIGAMVTHAALEDGVHRFADQGMLASVARGIAYRAIRNRGTIGGSLAHADPAADWPSALLALGATITVARRNGARELAVADLLHGAFATSLDAGEIVTSIAIPKLGPSARWGYYKICRKAGEFPDAIGAVVLDPDAGAARIVAGALDGPPVLLAALAARVAAEGAAAASDAAVSAAIASAAPGLDPVEARLHAVAVRRAVVQAFAR